MKLMFAVLHSDINSLKSGYLYQTGHPYCKKGRSVKVKDGIKNLILKNYLIDRYSTLTHGTLTLSIRALSIKTPRAYTIKHYGLVIYRKWTDFVECK